MMAPDMEPSEEMPVPEDPGCILGHNSDDQGYRK
jgi:hypothetical protein